MDDQALFKTEYGKTELIEVCPFQHQNCSVKFPPIKVNSKLICPSRHVKSLGFHYDDRLSLKNQVNDAVRVCNYRLHNLYKIGSKLSQSLKHQLVQSYVLFNLDYCNAMYVGLNRTMLGKLQTIQMCQVCV